MKDLPIQQKFKNLVYPLNHGYARRFSTKSSLSIVIHTTGNAKITSFESEEKHLFHSRHVSTHFLVSRDGRIIQHLPTDIFAAWHAGATTKIDYSNQRTIGIEMHHSVPDEPLQEQKDLAAKLCQELMKKHTIREIVMHRTIAKPKGRKIDPTNFTDHDFNEWVRRLRKDM